MAEYIERNALLEKLRERDLCLCVSEADIEEAPAADVMPVVNSCWVKPSIGAWEHYCSSCKGPKPYFYGYGDLDSAFCPHCGAKMDKEET